jgi:hypothetical protein
MQSQDASRAPGTFDNPVGLLQNGDDVVALHGFQGELLPGGGRRLRQSDPSSIIDGALREVALTYLECSNVSAPLYVLQQ